MRWPFQFHWLILKNILGLKKIFFQTFKNLKKKPKHFPFNLAFKAWKHDLNVLCTVLVIISGPPEISVNVEYLVSDGGKNLKSSKTALVDWQLIFDKQQQMIKQVYINLFIFRLFLKILCKKKKKRKDDQDYKLQ